MKRLEVGSILILRISILLILPQIVALIIIAAIVWFIRQYPIQEVDPLINTGLTVSSVLFGFLTTSMILHLEELRKQEKDVSDLARELLRLLDQVRNNRELSNRNIHFSTKYYKWGFKGLGVSGEAEEVILEAYDYLLKSFRYGIHIRRSIVFMLSIPGLLLLFATIILAIISKFISFDPNYVAMLSMVSITFGVLVTILGWLYTDMKIEENYDSLFNIRHTILGDLYRNGSLVGYME
jgi:hypothetical protein